MKIVIEKKKKLGGRKGEREKSKDDCFYENREVKY